MFTPPKRSVSRVFLHCSASDNPKHDDVSVIRRWHTSEPNNWRDVGYHYFINKDGTVQPGRDLEWFPAAQAGHNRGSIAICCHGLDVAEFTREQYVSLVELCRQIRAAYEGEVTFHGHCEVSQKSCPVFPYRAVLGLNEDGYMIYEANVEPKVPEHEPDDDLPVLRISSRGNTVRFLQRLLNQHGHELKVDGKFGQATQKATKVFQKEKCLQVDGVVGANTWGMLCS